MTNSQSHYDVLGVSEDTSQEEIKDAFFDLVREHPPEQNPDAYQQLREAYDVLSDPVSRREYDTMAQHGDEIEALQEEAEALLNQEPPAPQAAIKKLKRATVLGPDISLLRNMLGQAYLMDEQPEEALKQFDEAVDLNPDNEAHHLNRGYALRELERPREAEKAFRVVWEDDKGNYAAARGVAGALADREWFYKADKVLDETIWADDVLNFEDFFCYYDKLHLYLAQQKTEALEEALDAITEMVETPEDRQYAAFMLVQTADELQAAGAFGLAHRFGEAAKELDERSVDPEVVEQVGELRDLEEGVEAIMDSGRYHEAVQQMVAIYYDQFTGAMSERQAEEATENLVQGLDNLMQADPDNTEIKESLRHIRSRHPEAFELNPEFFEAILDVPDADLFVDECPHCGEPMMAEKGVSANLVCPQCNQEVHSDGENYFKSRSASKRQSSTNSRSTSTRSRNSETQGSTGEPHSGSGSEQKRGGKSNSFEGGGKLDEDRMVCKECGVIVRGKKKKECPKCEGDLSDEKIDMEKESTGPKEFVCPRCSRTKVTGNNAQSPKCSNCGGNMRPESKSASGTSNTDDDCFVATAVYGSYDHPEVRQLRRFRDETLRHTAWGRAFILWYYRYGPRLAERMDGHPRLKRGVRWTLQQVVARWLR
jgi:curved DNA-binding protein CbpA